MKSTQTTECLVAGTYEHDGTLQHHNGNHHVQPPLNVLKGLVFANLGTSTTSRMHPLNNCGKSIIPQLWKKRQKHFGGIADTLDYACY